MNTRERIKEFIETETQKKVETYETNLIETGILDSFTMIKLINFIETELGIEVNMEELSPANFNSLITIEKTIL